MKELPESDLKETVLWLLRRRRRVGVTGTSMLPLLRPGDEVLVDTRAFRQERPQVGDIVIARRPDRQEVEMIKRVSAITRSGDVILLGDNPTSSTDSREFGVVSLQHLGGLVTSKFG